jgi:secretion/DNA translocation related TadE-like protein
VVVVLTAALVALTAVRDVHRARSAADLAALAAAGGQLDGGLPDCAAAARVVVSTGGGLDGCRALADGSVVVDVAIRARWPAGWPGLPAAITASARAGPEWLGTG